TEIDSEITSLDDQIAKSNRRKRLLAEEGDIFRAILAPIRRLSMEVLDEIFIQCLLNNGITDQRSYISSRSAPLLLKQVCRRWRTTALMTLTLFTDLAIGPETPG
ncbi:hypothetical protein M422DRAFT_80678, partial [Sphaerobolus stellatus SS14]